ncbi:MAG TPA: hypothetical protein VMG10_31340, partial [Gemmataceae bacterium]|nr:hypothetical protein [Gemmataceae bacterium]
EKSGGKAPHSKKQGRPRIFPRRLKKAAEKRRTPKKAKQSGGKAPHSKKARQATHLSKTVAAAREEWLE